MAIDPWQRLPATGQVWLRAEMPNQNLIALHAVARSRLALLRAKALGRDPVHEDLKAALERRDEPARDWQQRQALRAAGEAELDQIEAGLARAGEQGQLDSPGWSEAGPADFRLRGEALDRWCTLALRRRAQLLPILEKLRAEHEVLRQEVEAARAARIRALMRKLTEQQGFSWHELPDPAQTHCPPSVRAAMLEAVGGPACHLTLTWRYDEASGLEWLRWQSQEGARLSDGSVGGREAVTAALQPVALAA
ncbi:hypothetical protein EOD42_15040 [Rhodovarius crocodyli]|uniref:Uncharacterized protein n=1 Tax=Rhodovarius crocodyli TaxID=1979269 RepID=A0A437MD08_9PROT|nr:hypothetical protein [Rhodovarius crocodyli]RVT95526.1 hypothetical protein EOD42_15040 [Rhodovarius crocodyli]